MEKKKEKNQTLSKNVSQQKIALSQEYTGKEKSLKLKFELVNTHKHKTGKCLRELGDTLSIITEKVNNPLSFEDFLKETVIETAFPNIKQLLWIFLLISSSEAFV